MANSADLVNDPGMLERRLFFMALGVSGAILGLIYRSTAEQIAAAPVISIPAMEVAGNLTAAR